MKNVELLRSNGVDVDSSLELLGDMEMYDETLEEFLSEIDNRINDLKSYKDSNDMNNYAILVHALKSDSKYLGFTKLAELAFNHEMQSKANNSSYINDNYDELITEVNRIVEATREYLN